MTTQLRSLLCALGTAACLSLHAHAEAAKDITGSVRIETTGLTAGQTAFTDGKISTHGGGANVSFTLSSDLPMGGLSIVYNAVPEPGTLDGRTTIAAYGFLHEYISLNGALSAVLFYPQADICEIRAYSVGELPADVQRWEPGGADTDLMLFATHSDDDQLFFAGLLPYYTSRGARVQVAYFINHYDTYNRTHELLDGLWHCGVTRYPEISPFPDGYSESAAGAADFLVSKGFTREDCVSFQRTLLDTYKPLVAVLHDTKGEYGHGAHILNTATFLEACENASDGNHIPDKIYIHLYPENTLTLDIDTPLAAYDGKTAFQVSQEAFRFHKSQHWTWFYEWLYGKNDSRSAASQIRSYNPAKYGLYATRVGADSGVGDMLENIVTYAEREQEAKRLEEQRQKEEEARREQERLKQLAAEEQARAKALEAENDRLAARQKRNKNMITGVILLTGIAALAAVFLSIASKKRGRRSKKR